MNLQILKVINEIGKGWGGKRAEEGLLEQKQFGQKFSESHTHTNNGKKNGNPNLQFVIA